MPRRRSVATRCRQIAPSELPEYAFVSSETASPETASRFTASELTDRSLLTLLLRVPATRGQTV